MSWRGWALAGILCGAINCVAQSFDCTAARTATEKTVCASPELGRLDVRLNAIYRETMALSSPNEKEALRREQRLWGKSNGAECAGETSCLKKRYEARIAEFLAMPIAAKKYAIPDDVKNDVAKADAVRITYRMVTVKKKNPYEIDLAYPRFTGAPAEMVSSLNQYVVKRLVDCDHAKGSYIDQSFAVVKLNTELLALRESYDIYCEGAAHPDHDSVDHFVELKTGEDVDLWALLPGEGRNALIARLVAGGKKLKDDDECKALFVEDDFAGFGVMLSYEAGRMRLMASLPHAAQVCEDAVDASISIDELMQMYPQASPARKVLTALAR